MGSHLQGHRLRTHEQKCRSQESDRPAAQRLDRQVAEQKQDRTAHRVEREDVAPPDKVEMDEAEYQQPEHARIMRRRRPPRGRHRALDDEQGRGAEQHREQAAHLRIDEHEIECPYEPVEAAVAAERHRVEIRPAGQSESIDVHRQYAHDGDAARRVEAGIAFERARRGRGADLWRCRHGHDVSPPPASRSSGPVLTSYYSQVAIWSSGFLSVAWSGIVALWAT